MISYLKRNQQIQKGIIREIWVGENVILEPSEITEYERDLHVYSDLEINRRQRLPSVNVENLNLRKRQRPPSKIFSQFGFVKKERPPSLNGESEKVKRQMPPLINLDSEELKRPPSVNLETLLQKRQRPPSRYITSVNGKTTETTLFKWWVRNGNNAEAAYFDTRRTEKTTFTKKHTTSSEAS